MTTIFRISMQALQTKMKTGRAISHRTSIYTFVFLVLISDSVKKWVIHKDERSQIEKCNYSYNKEYSELLEMFNHANVNLEDKPQWSFSVDELYKLSLRQCLQMIKDIPSLGFWYLDMVFGIPRGPSDMTGSPKLRGWSYHRDSDMCFRGDGE